MCVCWVRPPSEIVIKADLKTEGRFPLSLGLISLESWLMMLERVNEYRAHLYTRQPLWEQWCDQEYPDRTGISWPIQTARKKHGPILPGRLRSVPMFSLSLCVMSKLTPPVLQPEALWCKSYILPWCLHWLYSHIWWGPIVCDLYPLYNVIVLRTVCSNKVPAYP